MEAQLIEMVKRHEGYRARAYRDTKGILTIGYGRNIENVGISEEEALILLANDLASAKADLRHLFPKLETFTPARQAALIDMMFNMGAHVFGTFGRMIAAIHNGDWELAALEAADSQWYRQTGQRAVEIVAMLRTGEWQA